MEQNKNKKIMLSIIGVAILVIGLVGITYAFFNYTRTGASNNIKVGRISFVSKDEETITLNNLFPIDPENTTDMNDSTKVGTYQITIEGDTDYSGGIEYLVSTTNSDLSNLPISINMTVGNGLGTNDTNYFTSRDTATTPIYKKLVGDTLVGDQMLLVGFISQNTNLGTSDETGDTITIKAYLDKNKILISDTYDGTESDNMGTPNSMAQGKTVLTTTEWNAIKTNGVSFKIKVEANEGIWVNGSLEEIMKKENIGIDTENGVDFSKTSDQDGTKGVYLRAGTQNDAYPIVYYRGAVENNNVIFNNKCWKAVRTTDTGGVKLIYNGLPDIEGSGNNITYNCGVTRDIQNNMRTTISLRQSTGYFYADDYEIVSTSGNSVTYKLKSKTNPIIQVAIADAAAATTKIPDIATNYPYTCKQTTESGTCETLYKVDSYASGTNAYVYSSRDRTIIENSAINTNVNSPAYIGYMYGDVYTYNSGDTTSGAYYGSGFTYSNGAYMLTNPSTTKDNTHHYTCNLTTADGTCTIIRYYYYEFYYVNLIGGEGIESAMEKMQANTTSSTAKTQIDSWYVSNMNTVTNKLEDTIWCNDRSVGNGNNNGWIANGGDLNTYLYYGARERSNYASNTSTVKNQPSLACTNKNDAFTVSNGKGNRKLTYPIALLTEDEIVLAGGQGGFSHQSSTFYLNSGEYYWSMSPYYFNYGEPHGFYVGGDSILSQNVYGTIGLRPAISIKPGQPITKGLGTVLDPYVIE